LGLHFVICIKCKSFLFSLTLYDIAFIIVLVLVVQGSGIFVFVVIYYLIFAVTLFYALYFFISGWVGLVKKAKVSFEKVEAKNRFAILIPARNEEMVIGNLIDSLKNQNYPREFYTIYAIPNNSSDRTEEVARSHGATILNCSVPTKTKGDVLEYAFSKLGEREDIDAYIVFDADNVVHPDFLSYMNSCLESGYSVAQGYRDSKNPSDNWLSGSYTLFYLFQNIFFNQGRMALGGSASINGTGFMIKKEFIDEVGFQTFTLTEDVEFSGQCALRGEKLVFVENAITYDEYPVSFIPSWKQRKRWSAGILECMKRYFIPLLKRYFKTKEMASFDMALVYLGPLMQVLNFINIVMLIVFKVAGITLYDLFSYLFASGLSFFLITSFIGILIEVFMLVLKKKKVISLISGILLFPVFIISWIPINISCIIKKHTKWEEIKHDRSVKINDVMN